MKKLFIAIILIVILILGFLSLSKKSSMPHEVNTVIKASSNKQPPILTGPQPTSHIPPYLQPSHR